MLLVIHISGAFESIIRHKFQSDGQYTPQGDTVLDPRNFDEKSCPPAYTIVMVTHFVQKLLFKYLGRVHPYFSGEMGSDILIWP